MPSRKKRSSIGKFVSWLRSGVYIAGNDIDWSNCPEEIDYGAPLTNLHLCAVVAGVPGKFVYSPAIGHRFRELKPQILNVTFIPDDKYYRNINSSITIDVVKAAPRVEWPLGDWVYAGPLSANYLNAHISEFDKDLFGTFTYDPPAGTYLDNGFEYTLSVKFTTDPQCRKHYLDAAVVSKTVKASYRKIPVIHWDEPDNIYHKTLLSKEQLNAKCDVPGTFHYHPPEGTMLEVGEMQELRVVFYPFDSMTYEETDMSVDITVVPQVRPQLIWNPVDVEYGAPLTELQLNAVCINHTGTFDYNGNKHGTKLLKISDNQVLHTTFHPSNPVKYATVQLSSHIKVVKVTPTIEWVLPSHIYEGQKLDRTILNARVVPVRENDLQGTLYYSPDVGAKLRAGQHNLTVSFITDAKCLQLYNKTAKISVTLKVLRKEKPTVICPSPLCEPIYHMTKLADLQLQVTTEGNIDGKFTYDPDSASILPVGVNQIMVTFTPTDKYRYETVVVHSEVEVIPQLVPLLQWNPRFTSMEYGEKLTVDHLNATCSDQEGRFEYNPPLDGILDVGQSVPLVATFYPHSHMYAITTIERHFKVKRTYAKIVWPKPKPIFEGTPLRLGKELCAKVEPVIADELYGTYEYKPAPNTRLQPGRHALTVEFKPCKEHLVRYMPKSTLSTNIEVIPRKTVTLAWNTPPNMTYGEPITSLQHCAYRTDTLPCTGVIRYDPSVGRYLDANENRWIRATFIPDNQVEYAPVTAEVTITIHKATPVIRWRKPVSVYMYSEVEEKLHYQVQIEQDECQDGTFVYDPPLGTKLLLSGEVTLNVTYYPSKKKEKNWTSVSACETLYVLSLEAPKLVWSDPDPIHYGELVSGKQLNATCENTSGQFSYDIPLGTKLPAGEHSIIATFTPDDISKYFIRTKKVQLVVKKSTLKLEWKPKKLYSENPLSEEQLNAAVTTEDVRDVAGGKFIYTPVTFGDYLEPGTTSIGVVYEPSPTDAKNYLITSMFIDLLVVKRNAPVPIPKEVYKLPMNSREYLNRPPLPNDFIQTKMNY